MNKRYQHKAVRLVDLIFAMPQRVVSIILCHEVYGTTLISAWIYGVIKFAFLGYHEPLYQHTL